MIRRRPLLVGAAAAIVGLPAIRAARGILAPLPAFEPLSDPPGFRRIAGGSTSLGGNVFIGLDEDQNEEAHPAPKVSVADLRANICDALFGARPETADTVAIASFSDYYCPYCRIQTKRLAQLAEDPTLRIRVSWHELPLLGRASLVAARAALAAKRQDAYLRFHARLLGTPFQPTPGYLRSLASEIGLDPDRLLADMTSPEVQRELDQSAALSDLFGLIGTPAMVIGRTVVQGRIPDRTLLKIIENERESGWAEVCQR